MRLRNALLGAAGAVGAVAGGNALLRGDADDLEPPLGRPLSTYRWRGFDVAYTEAGDPDDPTLVLLHGVNAAGSSHEFRYVVDDLAEEYHVLAPDLPGFGHSDRPPLLYSATLYVTFVADFLRDVADGTLVDPDRDAATGGDRDGEREPPAVVASSLVGAYTAAAVAEKAAPARQLFLVCPTASAFPGRSPAIRSLVRAPLVGEAVHNLISSEASIRYFLGDHGFSSAAAVPEEWVAYDYATTHVPGARYAPASFLSGYLNLDADLAALLSEIREAGTPVTVCWGGVSEVTPVSQGRELAEAADVKLVVLEEADLLPHGEFPETFLSVLREELAGEQRAPDASA
ncbi:alpha/beta fold hydrolase [Haloglomus litoreum]|uniref:alpha/beta fold hydrolase n=1 Tax=Haloglomus litoreum TaxID=3034026 RepID=UPI0023E872F6|nr:alpha/beta hydrolase [Haloglomus sp. DT116]